VYAEVFKTVGEPKLGEHIPFGSNQRQNIDVLTFLRTKEGAVKRRIGFMEGMAMKVRHPSKRKKKIL